MRTATQARQDAPELARMREQSAAVETAVDDAITAGDFDAAYRLAPGHPDAAGHVMLMARIRDAQEAAKDDAPLTPAEAKAALEGIGTKPAGIVPTGDGPSWRAFNLAAREVAFKNLNLRTETHGTEQVPAADLKFEVNLDGAHLAMFSPWLPSVLFYRSDDDQDLADASHPAPNLRLAKLAPLTWRGEVIGARVTVHRGTSETSWIVFETADVVRFKIAPKEGGQALVTFTVQVSRVEPEHVAHLLPLLKGTVTLSVAPPETGWASDEPEEDEEDHDQ